MSVYTQVEPDQLKEFLRHYNIGTLTDYHGISDGIENTNFFVDTNKGRFVLTLFEQLDASELPYFLNLMAFLGDHDVATAHPIADKQQQFLRELNGKPAALVERLSGKSVATPNITQCQAIGSMLGKFHIHSQSIDAYRENTRSPHWWKESIDKLADHPGKENAKLLTEEIAFQAKFRTADLPTGIIHADLFRDNALFDGNKITGIIDFYYACNDALIYDLAVVVNDWCSLADGSLDQKKSEALIQAYSSERPLTKEESSLWGVFLRAAALRFWISRLCDLHFPRPGEITHTKDPKVFEKIFKHRVGDFNNLSIACG
jgi:homoserine kinase type II